MSEEKDPSTPTYRPGPDDWLLTGHEQPATGGRGRIESRLHRVFRPVALVAAGLLIGGGAIAAAPAVTGDSDSGNGDVAETRGSGDQQAGQLTGQVPGALASSPRGDRDDNAPDDAHDDAD